MTILECSVRLAWEVFLFHRRIRQAHVSNSWRGSWRRARKSPSESPRPAESFRESWMRPQKPMMPWAVRSLPSRANSGTHNAPKTWFSTPESTEIFGQCSFRQSFEQILSTCSPAQIPSFYKPQTEDCLSLSMLQRQSWTHTVTMQVPLCSKVDTEDVLLTNLSFYLPQIYFLPVRVKYGILHILRFCGVHT